MASPRIFGMTDQIGIDFDGKNLVWPSQRRFPRNDAPETVRDVVRQDLQASESPLVITGYTSLEWLIRLLADLAGGSRASTAPRSIRVLLGNEPALRYEPQRPLTKAKVSQDITDYWLDRGVSLRSCGMVIKVMELLREGFVEVRSSGERLVHAKIYATDPAVTLGSSNFSLSGMETQVEANVRFERAEKKRFEEASLFAENVWEYGEPYNDGLMALLEQLLKHVTWQEALARACAEVLDGEWARQRLQGSNAAVLPTLWPSQQQGIAQAMWILENMGSVLIADATGSGKTRMGIRLLRTLLHHVIRSGRDRGATPVLFIPPAAKDLWEVEAVTNQVAVHTFSHGLLSRAQPQKNDMLTEVIRKSQILAVDEAHNFLSRQSIRTRRLYENAADHVLLFTATPLNRGPQDLLAIIDILGADNFDPAVLKVVERIRKGRIDELSRGELTLLKRAIQRFTVRRTKTMLNRMIDEDPESYVDRFGHPCRYPLHHAIPYPCQESKSDIAIAEAIRGECEGLLGMTRLQGAFVVSDAQQREGVSDDRYLAWRLAGAKGLARHGIAACLRSSSVALLEYLRGTEAVRGRFPELGPIKSMDTGAIIQQLHRIAGSTPESRLSIPLPSFLTDSGLHREACLKEAERYASIGAFVEDLSENREVAKADLLIGLAKRHSLVIAFDSKLVSLYRIKSVLESRMHPDRRIHVIVATGQTPGARQELIERFKLGSGESQIIALCSDAHAQAINLQEAAAVVHLDFPSVPRLAEQRVGRVDRLDSPHDEIEVYWPDDDPAFAVRADERFFERHSLVADLLGSNIPAPELKRRLETDANRVIRYTDMVDSVDQVENIDDWSELVDALAPVRAFVDGGKSLVPTDIYRRLRKSKARVLSSISVVSSAREFGFFAISGVEFGSPLWVFLDGIDGDVTVDLARVANELRDVLKPGCADRQFDDTAALKLDRMLSRLYQLEESTLPPLMRRALDEMRFIVGRYAKHSAEKDLERREICDRLLSLLSSKERTGEINLRALAQWWLDTIQPVRLDALTSTRRRRPLLLKHLRKRLIDEPLDTSTLLTALERELVTAPLEHRVVAAIIGVVD